MDNYIILRELKEDKRHAAFLASRFDYQEQIVLKGIVLAPRSGRIANHSGGVSMGSQKRTVSPLVWMICEPPPRTRNCSNFCGNDAGGLSRISGQFAFHTAEDTIVNHMASKYEVLLTRFFVAGTCGR